MQVKDGHTVSSVAQPPPPTLNGVLHGVPSFYEYLSGAALIRLCCVSKDFRTTAIKLSTQVLVSERRACFGVPPYSDTKPAEREVLPEGFPVARLPGLIAQSEALLSEAALQISYTMQTTVIPRVRVVARAPIRPLARRAAEFPDDWSQDSRQDFEPLSGTCSTFLESDTCRDEMDVLPLNLDALWWAEVEEEVRQGLRQTPVSSGGPFTRHDVLRVLALRAALEETYCTNDYVGRFSMGLFLLKDGRVALVGTDTDVDSWDNTHVERHVEVSRSLDVLVRLGMANWERRYLRVSMPEDKPADVRGHLHKHHHTSGARGGGGAADWEDRRGSKRRREERGSGGGSRTRRRKEVTGTDRVWGTGGKWRIEEGVPSKSRHEKAGRWGSPFPLYWDAQYTQHLQADKRPSSSQLSLQLASSDAVVTKQECFDPLPGVTMALTEWREAPQVMDPLHVWPVSRGLLQIWQIDNRSTEVVHFCFKGPGSFNPSLRPPSRVVRGTVAAGRCVDVLCGQAPRGVEWEVVSDGVMWEREQYEMEMKRGRWQPPDDALGDSLGDALGGG